MSVVISKQVCKLFAIPVLEPDSLWPPQGTEGGYVRAPDFQDKVRLGPCNLCSLSHGAGFQVLSHLVRNLADSEAAMLEGPQRVTMEVGVKGWSKRDRAEEAQLLDFSQRGLHTQGERVFCWFQP